MAVVDSPLVLTDDDMEETILKMVLTAVRPPQ
jgi:hypothetical protein